LVARPIDGCSSVNTESYPRISVGNKSNQSGVLISGTATHIDSEAVLTTDWHSKDMFHVPTPQFHAGSHCLHAECPRHYVYNCWQVVCSTITQHCL